MNSSSFSPSSERLDKTGRKKSLAAACLGNTLEWFDWSLYGIFSVYLAKNMFDPKDPTSGLLATLAVFAVAFVARPIGGLVFGRMGDRMGRKRLMYITMSLLAVSSLALALLPTYADVGVFASALLLLVRLIQGLAHGGEVGVTYTYAAEIAPPEHRGLWSSWVLVGNTGGLILATATAAALTSFLDSQAMNDYGWRIGFALGGLLGFAALWLRRTVMESDVFVAEIKAKTKHQLSKRSTESWTDHVRIALQIMSVSLGSYITFYAWATFAPQNAISKFGIDPKGAFAATLIAEATILVTLPLIGALSDRIGRRPLVIAQGLLMAALAYPINNMISDNPWTLFFAVLLGLGIWAIQAAVFVAIAAELAPTRVRATTLGFVVSFGVAIFGGSAPYLNTWLASRGQSWVFTLYIIVLGLLTVLGGIWIRETRGLDLRELDASDSADGSSMRLPERTNRVGAM